MRVLIADDDPTLRLLLGTVFRKDGWQVSLANDAMQTVMVAGRAPQPDLILLDLGMPAGTGMTALERLRMSNRTSGIPVVVVSGAVDQHDIRARVEELGVASVVEKPVDPDAILRVARDAVGGGNA